MIICIPFKRNVLDGATSFIMVLQYLGAHALQTMPALFKTILAPKNLKEENEEQGGK